MLLSQSLSTSSKYLLFIIFILCFLFKGKRVCLGEQLARMELFIFFTHLMHRFSFQKPAATEGLNLERCPGAVSPPYPYYIRAITRT